MKHSEEEPLNLGWLADRGAREAPLDSQGFLKEEPKRDSVSTDRYDLLLKGLYEAARWFAQKTGSAAYLEIYAEGLSDFDPDAAHQIREGIRDSAKAKPSIGSIGSICGSLGLAEAFQNIHQPTEQPTTKGEFSEEEIAEVRQDAALGKSAFATMYGYYLTKKQSAAWINDIEQVKKWDRLAAIAEHLAKQEG